jgi:hypothetical protein
VTVRDLWRALTLGAKMFVVMVSLATLFQAVSGIGIILYLFNKGWPPE